MQDPARPFVLDGWTISPCAEGSGYDVMKDGKGTHASNLEKAVRGVQGDSPGPLSAVSVPEDRLPPKEKASLLARLLSRVAELEKEKETWQGNSGK
jgi:hypothetical protein